MGVFARFQDNQARVYYVMKIVLRAVFCREAGERMKHVLFHVIVEIRMKILEFL